MEADTPQNGFEKFINKLVTPINTPVTWFREKVVEPNRPNYYWYHRKFRRVPTIDECYTDDIVCITEADEQYKRDKMVENEILFILRKRKEDCVFYEGPDALKNCAKVMADYKEAETNWFMKYGDLGYAHNTVTAFMKQKHRMIWEQRHGPVGSGMKDF